MVHSWTEAVVVQTEPLLEEARGLDGVDGLAQLEDSVWAEVRKSATKSFGPMGTPAMIRPSLYWMYAKYT